MYSENDKKFAAELLEKIEKKLLNLLKIQTIQ